MVRHLLALFALLTGIAALNAPAYAGEAQSSVHNARSVSASDDTTQSEKRACAESARQRSSACVAREPRKSWTWLPSWLRPSIFFGGDRALE